MKCTRYFAACILLALEHLHNHDIIYKDLKSENIVISKDGEPKLTDFGMSTHKFKVNKEQREFFLKTTTPCITAPEIL